MFERPQGFEKEHNDCTIRAISLATNKPYKDVHAILKQHGRKDRHRINFRNIATSVFNDLNVAIDLVGYRGTVNSVVKRYPKGHLLCLKRGHAFTVIDGVAHDLPSMNCRIIRAWLIK